MKKKWYRIKTKEPKETGDSFPHTKYGLFQNKCIFPHTGIRAQRLVLAIIITFINDVTSHNY